MGSITLLNLEKKIVLAVTLVSFLTLLGCSSKGSKAIVPTKLEAFEQSIKIKKRWATRIGMGVENNFVGIRPAATERFIYAGDVRGRLFALDRKTGDSIWKVKTGDVISSGLNAAYGMITYGTRNGEIVARSEKDGSELWRKALSSEVLAVPQMNADTVLVQTIDGHLYGLVRDTGEKRWVYSTTVPVLTLRGTSAPVIYHHLALAGFSNGKLVAINLSDGNPVWEKQVTLPVGRSELERIVDIDGGFWVEGSVVYAATYQGKMAAIDISTGRLIWQRELSSHAGVVEASGSLYVPDSAGFVWAFDSSSGSEVWQQEGLAARKLSAPAIFDDFILVGDYKGYLHWISRKDGSFAGRVRIDEEGVRVKPIVKGDMVYVHGDSGALLALQLSEKNLKPKKLYISGKRRALR